MASAGELHSVLLRSDGYVVALGQNVSGQCDIPDLDEGISYTQAGFMKVLSFLNENPRYKMVYNTVYCIMYT
jgi:alpha-tubulin suppressor-like RCC1 family protein